MKAINYDLALIGLSDARMKPYDILFARSSSSCEKYAAYVWAQNTASLIYPLVHGLEVTLRNAIDVEARNRFGDFWWNRTGLDDSRSNAKSFDSGIRKAEKSVGKRWMAFERQRLGLHSEAPLPASSILPELNHDDVVAATDFAVWRDLLSDAHCAPKGADRELYLWPKSMGKVFKKYHMFSSKPNQARLELLNALSNIKEYRNRLFHHDCIWVKREAKNRRGAIDSIRNKINLIEKIIQSTSPASFEAMEAWGIFENAREICTESALEETLSKCRVFDAV